MHILVISHMYPNMHNPNFGIFVKKQIESLQKLGIEVTVLAPVPMVFPLLKYFSSKWSNYSTIPKEEKNDNTRVIHSRFLAIPGGYFKQYWSYCNYFLFRKKITELHKNEKIDIIHVQGSAPDDYAGFLISKKLKIIYIQTLHGDALLSLSKNVKKFSRSKVAIEKANAVIAVSSKIEKKVYELTDRKRNIFKIFNGYDSTNIGKIDRRNIAQNNLTILFAGNLIAQKGCDFLIEAFKKVQLKHNNISLQIVGTGIERKKLEKKVIQLEINKLVQFWGYLEHEKLMTLMAESDIFIMPSWDEAFGVVYLEAMSLKKPVIGTLGEGIDSFIVDGENGLLVEPRSVHSIVEKLTLLIENKELRDKIARNGYQSAKRLTWEFNAKELLKVYKTVLASK